MSTSTPPILIVRKGQKLPSARPCYVIGDNGLFFLKETGIIKAVVEVKGVSGLETIKPMVELKVSRLNNALAVQILCFFKEVYHRYHSEAIVLLHYSVKQQEYLLICPQQTVSGASLEYNATERFSDYQLIGTIHSHANFAAAHSGVDDLDESNFDGLHITFGHVNGRFFSVSCSIVVNGNRFIIAATEAIEGIEEVKIAEQSLAKSTEQGGLPVDLSSRPVTKSRFNKGPFYTLGKATEEVDYSQAFPVQWLDRVNHCVKPSSVDGANVNTMILGGFAAAELFIDP